MSKRIFSNLCKLSKWSTLLIPIILYFIFIACMINMTFPIKQIRPFINDNTDKLMGKEPIVNLENYKEDIPRNKENTQSNHKSNNISLRKTNRSNKENIILKIAFKQADENSDRFLTIEELSRYINEKIRDHIDKAIELNPINFLEIDSSPKDGLISWDEYHAYFLKEHGLDENYIKDHNEKNHIKLNRKSKEEMMRDKAIWSEIAQHIEPYSLTIDEFLAFRHPESSIVNLLSLVEDILKQFDLDGDEHLTIEEFADIAIDGDEDIEKYNNPYKRSIIFKTIEERRDEFNRVIDKNHDGRADKGELLIYVDPKHPRYALYEAITLVNLTDINKDGKLSLEEVLENSKIFMSSKMIETSNSFHDEF